jgi:hypothetical protein
MTYIELAHHILENMTTGQQQSDAVVCISYNGEYMRLHDSRGPIRIASEDDLITDENEIMRIGQPYLVV